MYMKNIQNRSKNTVKEYYYDLRNAFRFFKADLYNLDKSDLNKIDIIYSISTGNIEDLSSLLKLTTLSVKGCNELTGEILNLLLQMCNRGRTEGSLQITATETAKITFKGQEVANVFYVTFNSNGCVVATNQEGTDVVATLTNGKWSFN